MRRLLQALLLALASLPALSLAGTQSCVDTVAGYFSDINAAENACKSQAPHWQFCDRRPNSDPPYVGWIVLTHVDGGTEVNGDYGSNCAESAYANDSTWDDYTAVAHIFYYADQCPDGTTENSNGQCVGPGNCDSAGDATGSTWDNTLEQCTCPEGQIDIMHPDVGYQCMVEPPECTPNSGGFLGYANDTPICDFNDFCGDGSSGGLINGNWACVPDTASCQPPNVEVNGSCMPQEQLTPNPSETFGPNASDLDGDGIPDGQDDDIDGDGIPNSQDNDIDGDGVSNENDTQKNGPGTGIGDGSNSGSATASGGCEQPPTCTGDPQECAAIKQQWYAMCYTEDYKSNDQGFYSPESTDDLDSRFEVALSTFSDRMQASELVSGVGSFFDFSGGGSCPSYSVSAGPFDITFDQWCSNVMPWGLISGILFAVALLISGRIVVS
ncbi:hypothetical protein ACJJH9_09845 [Microbulbifer sp. DLAB2-AF]|uniref:hypothetical protein n=1 Tax=Microbulbifer sp. DLAB2-AF TaxID=3243395 RepID=UPI0040391942